MADEEVATKAPESDAAEQTTVPGDTPAQEGPTMGVDPRPSRIFMNADKSSRSIV